MWPLAVPVRDRILPSNGEDCKEGRGGPLADAGRAHGRRGNRWRRRQPHGGPALRIYGEQAAYCRTVQNTDTVHPPLIGSDGGNPEFVPGPAVRACVRSGLATDTSMSTLSCQPIRAPPAPDQYNLCHPVI